MGVPCGVGEVLSANSYKKVIGIGLERKSSMIPPLCLCSRCSYWGSAVAGSKIWLQGKYMWRDRRP
jgi:hypothetical protein